MFVAHVFFAGLTFGLGIHALVTGLFAWSALLLSFAALNLLMARSTED